MKRFSSVIVMLVLMSTLQTKAQWHVLPPDDQRRPLPDSIPENAEPISPKDAWPADQKFRWLMAELTIPATIDGTSTQGKAVGMQINCGDGGEVYVNRKLISRYDNDHPALVLLADKAVPGTTVNVAVLVYGRVQGGDTFDEATWVIIPPKRAHQPVKLTVHVDEKGDRVPEGLVGLSQGGGLADYDDATADKLKEAGFRWFRMDNILTNALKEKDGELVYDWTDLDRRVDFIVGKMGADAIFAASYMPHALDAIPNKDRQSAPKSYQQWEELCYQAAKRCAQRGKRVKYWEVWNEANTGWIKPGPEDKGTDDFKALYEKALGKAQPDQGTIRTFEAYCKLYRATARGVLRADPKAKVGGPALASGPFESEQYPYCKNGKGFTRGLMLWCLQEDLPLDFVSWHEYFHPADVFEKQITAMRDYLDDFPKLRKRVDSFMITEWNEAWWPNRPQDHEIGAAWAADCLTRVFIPKKIDRPCFFYVKQGDMNFRGDWSLLMANNTPKPTYNALKVFNNLSGRWVKVTGEDGDVSAVACWDAKGKTLSIVLVNFKYRHSFRRHVEVDIDALPSALKNGTWREWTIDATHSNIWNAPEKRESAELTQTRRGSVNGSTFTYDNTLRANSVILLEIIANKE